jgi:hypothetical protein
MLAIIDSHAIFGGALRQFVVDDKGCVAIGALGMHTISSIELKKDKIRIHIYTCKYICLYISLYISRYICVYTHICISEALILLRNHHNQLYPGVPHYTYENNCLRVVEIANILRKKIESFGNNCSIGISKGRAFCGLIGMDIHIRMCEHLYTYIRTYIYVYVRFHFYE